jgi:hypothetical protein
MTTMELRVRVMYRVQAALYIYILPMNSLPQANEAAAVLQQC